MKVSLINTYMVQIASTDPRVKPPRSDPAIAIARVQPELLPGYALNRTASTESVREASYGRGDTFDNKGPKPSATVRCAIALSRSC
jgi:hypothetical protein